MFLDELGIGWEYESECFDLPPGRYLPDFYIPSQDTWIEIKPALGDNSEPWIEQAHDERLHYFAEDHERFFVVFGSPGVPRLGADASPYAAARWGDSPYYFSECSSCSTVCLRFGYELECRPTHLCTGRADLISPRLISAYSAARSARFSDTDISHGYRSR